MEAIRQMLGAIYVALATAGGEEVMRNANDILKAALDAGAVNDVYARSALTHLVRAAEAKEVA
jgi:hypothetical protein